MLNLHQEIKETLNKTQRYENTKNWTIRIRQKGRGFKIYRVNSVSENGYTARATGEFYHNREEARRRVWQLNGWGTPKNKLN